MSGYSIDNILRQAPLHSNQCAYSWMIIAEFFFLHISQVSILLGMPLSQTLYAMIVMNNMQPVYSNLETSIADAGTAPSPAMKIQANVVGPLITPL